MKKIVSIVLAMLLVLPMCLATAAAAEPGGGEPVYIAVYGLQQLNRGCIWAWSSAGYVDSVQIWDGGTCIKDGWLQPGHEYTVKVQVKGVNVQLDGRQGVAYINGQPAWAGHGINQTDESQSWVMAKLTFRTPYYWQGWWGCGHYYNFMCR